MAGTPILQSIEDDAEDIDLKNKMAIASYVLKACIKESNKNCYMSRIVQWQRLPFLTNISSNLITKMLLNFKIPTVTDISEKKFVNTPELDFAIREALIYLYSNHALPTNLLIRERIPNVSQDSEIFKRLLKRSGYIWRRLPNTKRAIIMEHPQRTIQRQRYLEKLNFYRQENRTIVYVLDKIMNKENSQLACFIDHMDRQQLYVVLVLVVSEYKYLDSNVFTCNSISACQNLFEAAFLKNILSRLPQSSVIIMEDKPYYDKTLPVPTIESEKRDMMKWLDINNIPYDKSFHRCDLFELIRRMKVKDDLHKFDAVVRAHGHEILRRPSQTNYLCYFKPIWNKNVTSTQGNKQIITSIKNKNQLYWKSLETHLIANEKIIYDEDLAIENITDKILTMATTSDVDISPFADVECDLEEDTLKQADCLIEI